MIARNPGDKDSHSRPLPRSSSEHWRAMHRGSKGLKHQDYCKQSFIPTALNIHHGVGVGRGCCGDSGIGRELLKYEIARMVTVVHTHMDEEVIDTTEEEELRHLQLGTNLDREDRLHKCDCSTSRDDCSKTASNRRTTPKIVVCVDRY